MEKGTTILILAGIVGGILLLRKRAIAYEMVDKAIEEADMPPFKPETSEGPIGTGVNRIETVEGHDFNGDTAISLNHFLLKIREQGGDVTVVSGLRTRARQEELFANAVKRYGSEQAARKWVAKPGYSKHEQGNAVDFGIEGIANDSNNVEVIRSTKTYRIIKKYAPDFGFTPYSAEPWHWEYNSDRIQP